MFLIDFEAGELVPDDALKTKFAGKHPYAQWLEEQRIDFSDFDSASASDAQSFDPDSLLERLRCFGYTTETMQFMMLPLVAELRDPVGSMGNDVALACLSDRPRMIYDYFKQLFAQVTNPRSIQYAKRSSCRSNAISGRRAICSIRRPSMLIDCACRIRY